MATACIATEAGLVTCVQVRTCNVSIGDINFWCVSTLLCFWKWYICFFLSHAWMKLLWNLLKYSMCVIFLMVWQRRRSFCWESLLAGWLMSCCSSKRTRPSLKWGIRQLPQAWLNTMAVCLPLSGMEEHLNASCIWTLFRGLTKVWFMVDLSHEITNLWYFESKVGSESKVGRGGIYWSYQLILRWFLTLWCMRLASWQLSWLSRRMAASLDMYYWKLAAPVLILCWKALKRPGDRGRTCSVSNEDLGCHFLTYVCALGQMYQLEVYCGPSDWGIVIVYQWRDEQHIVTSRSLIFNWRKIDILSERSSIFIQREECTGSGDACR